MKPPILIAGLRRRLAALYLTHDRIRINITQLEIEAEALRAQILDLELAIKEETCTPTKQAN